MINQNKLLIVFGGIALAVFVVIVIWWNQKKIIDINGSSLVSPSVVDKMGIITGTKCTNGDGRLFSVMMPSDPETRPLSGIAQADMVFEMPVTPGGITRMMAVFQCEQPEKIGSIRSAREDFIPLAAGLKSIYAHWGGERSALTRLNAGVLDNLDALTNKGGAFYRAAGIKAPHNGFTSYERLANASELLKYEPKNSFAGYPHDDKKPNRNLSNLVDGIDIDFDTIYDVKWTYNPESNTYSRSRGGRPEIDKNNNQTVTASVVAVVHTTWTPLAGQYINVRVSGVGALEVYQNGVIITGTWQKATAVDSKLFFYDHEGKEIKFTPGKIWVEIAAK
ncbi:MAG: hypothetical protein UW43_C0007G0006 [Candidatus Yanofskybacteria bacterium GW2011_GWA1_44_21]|nr:MAG: hypothetical protein UW43_C0007G0006 [Candidatus Yanofskybacteria bacterium GW2011_GWA1_44_21]KKT89982.1 MAG: hypothetical protein UW90_C0009G0006 [Candidatus Yanofskybacteria bacterium GW2011_GWB1_45_11]